MHDIMHFNDSLLHLIHFKDKQGDRPSLPLRMQTPAGRVPVLYKAPCTERSRKPPCQALGRA